MSKKIQSTKNYSLFTRHSGENRPYDLKRHKALVESMTAYGFLECFPLVVTRHESGALLVKDGQHRLGVAEKLGLPVHYVESEKDFDVAVINSAARVWAVRDYAQKFAANGLKQYQEVIDFSERHAIPIGTAASLMSGTTTFSNIDDAFRNGEWVIKDRKWADAVAGIYGPLVKMSPAIRNARFIAACMAVCRVAGFDASRMITNADRCREKLVPYSTRDAYMEMLEAVYNFGRKQLVSLKNLAVMEMRERNAATTEFHAKKKAKEQTLDTAPAAR